MKLKKRRSYSQSFKQEAVKYIIEKGYSIAEASRHLGIEYSVLRRWKKQFEKSFASDSPAESPPETMNKSLLRLKDDLRRVTEERDILKKALAVFIENGKEN